MIGGGRKMGLTSALAFMASALGTLGPGLISRQRELAPNIGSGLRQPGRPGDRQRRGKIGNHRYCKATWTGSSESLAPGGADALRAGPHRRGEPVRQHVRRHAAVSLWCATHGTPGKNKRRNQAEREASARAIHNAHARCRLPRKGTRANHIERMRLRGINTIWLGR